MKSSLQSILMEAAQKAMGSELSDVFPKTAVKKANPKKDYVAYDVNLGEFAIPGRNVKCQPPEEQKMIAGLKVMVKKLQARNEKLKSEIATTKDESYKNGFADGAQKGFDQGYEKGKEDIANSINSIQGNVSNVVNSFQKAKESILDRAERKTLELVLQAVESVTKQEIRTDKNIILNVLKESLLEAAKTEEVIVRVSPTEVEHIEEKSNFWVPINAKLDGIKIEEDSRVEAGGCLIETSSGSVDARLDTQLQNIRETFLKCWEDNRPQE